MRAGQAIISGIMGYEETVIPQVENAILAGQDIIFLGERGQAKTRMARSLVNLLDDEIPIVRGSEINDNPFEPISRYAIDLIDAEGDSTPIDMTLRETGSVSMMSRVMTCVRDACCTSICGVSPDTVIVSSSAPTFMSALMVMTTSDGTCTASLTTVLNPGRVNVTV